MSTPRFFVDELAEGLAALPVHEARHALLSLRLREGDSVEVFDGKGGVGQGVLCGASAARRGKSRQAVGVRIVDLQREALPIGALHLLVAGCKGDRVAWMVEKCTELGASAIHFVEFERSVVQVGAPAIEKLRRATIEACKQCGRAWLPRLFGGETLRDAASAVPAGELLVAHPDPRAPTLSAAVADSAADSTARVVIGPEGGLSPAELDFLAQAGGRQVRLAAHVLRVETAAVAVAAAWSMCRLDAEARQDR